MIRSNNRDPRLLRTALLATLFFASGAFAATDTQALDYLQRMSQAAHTLNYEGTFVYLHANHVQSVRVVHGVDQQGEHERLVTLSGKSREVIRDNDEVKCFLPDDRSMQVDKGNRRAPLPMITPPNVERINHIYQPSLKGYERVAGREAAHVTLTPRDNYRYARDYWIDKEVGLLLRTELIDDRGQVVEQMMFTTIEILDTIPRDSLIPENSAKDFVVLRSADEQTAPQTLKTAAWEAEILPPGFELELMRHLAIQDKPGLVEHHVYGDGLASVSVFIEPPENSARAFIGRSRMGAVNAYTKRVGESRVVVVGEVPALTVEHLANAMRARKVETTP